MFHSKPFAAMFCLVVISILFGISFETADAQDEGSGGGLILFARQGNGAPGGEGLYVINADGTGERALFLFSDLGEPYDIYDGGYRCPAWSPDGSQIAFNGGEGSTSYVAVVDVATGESRRIVEVENDDSVTRRIYYPEWVPNSHSISYGFSEASMPQGIVTANGLRIVDIDSGDVTTVRDDMTLTYPNSTSPVYLGDVPNFLTLAHSWSPDGSAVAIASYNEYVYLTDTNGSEPRKLESSFLGSNDVDWSADGSRLVSALHSVLSYTPDDTDLRELWIRTNETGAERTAYYESVAWSPDGTQIAFASYWTAIIGGEFSVWNTISTLDVATGERTEILTTPTFTMQDYPYSIACVDWRPSGSGELPPPPPTPVVPPTPTPAPTCTISAGQNVNLRAEPSGSAAIAGTLTANANAEIDGVREAEGYTWYHVTSEAWVRGDIVRVDEACAGALPSR